MEESKQSLVIPLILAAVTMFSIVGIFWVMPKYNAWRKIVKAKSEVEYQHLMGEAELIKQELIGQAELKKAESLKRISIEGAKAEVESASFRAEAIEIVGEASKKYPEYRTQEFIGAFAEAMANGNIEKIIYIPTEANIPIIEAK